MGGQVNNGIKGYGFLIKLDSSLNKEWEKEFMLNNDTVYSYLGVLQSKQTYDKGYILVGDVDASGQYNTDILLIKTDSLGNKKWQKTYNYLGFDRGWNIIQTPDKGFLIGAGGYIATQTKSYNGLVIKTDSLGNEKWRRHFGGIYNDDKCIVANHPDGSYIVATSYCVIDSTPSHITTDYGYKTIHVIKLSQTNQVIWDKQYDSYRFWRSISNVTIDTQGMIYVLGKWWGEANDEIQVSTLLKLNSNGDSIWLREYAHLTNADAANALYDLKQTSDGGFIMCGQTDAPFTPYQSSHIWVLKVDSFGCDSPGCDHTGIRELEINNQKIVIYPNPTQNHLNIQLNQPSSKDLEIQLYDIVGKLIETYNFDNSQSTNQIDISKLKAGIYFVKVGIGEGELALVKFVKL